MFAKSKRDFFAKKISEGSKKQEVFYLPYGSSPGIG